MMKLELKIDNRKYSGWENVTISKSIQSIAHNFSMNIFNADGISIEDDDLIQILKDDKIFFTGYLDDMVIGISNVKKPLSINGRSKAGDLIDCNVSENKQYNKQNIKQIISDLVKPFNINVSSSLTLEPLEIFNTKVGETYFDAINRLCKQTNTLPISDDFGNIEIVKNEQNKSSIVLKDSDFKELNLPKKLSKRFSKYIYKKEGIVTDVTDGSATDDTVLRFKPFVGVNTEDKDNQDLAKWQLNHNKVSEISLTAVVKGWDLEINTIVKLETEIVNNSFLIKDITYSKSDSGTISNVTFVSKDLYDI